MGSFLLGTRSARSKSGKQSGLMQAVGMTSRLWTHHGNQVAY